MNNKKIVEIPKKYKKNIVNRWNINNAELSKYQEDTYIIYIPCKLCEDFLTHPPPSLAPNCNNCPFKIYEEINHPFKVLGCISFLSLIIDQSYQFFHKICGRRCVTWDKEIHDEVKSKFELINQIAPNYIKWI